MTTFAICGAKAVTEISDTNNYGAETSANTGTTCAPPSRALSGGIGSNAGDVLIVRMGLGNQLFDWINSFRNVSLASTAVRSSTRCSSGYELRYRSSSAAVRKGEAGKVVARCRKDEAVAGGGLRSRTEAGTDFDTWAAATRPWDSKQDENPVPEDGWLVRAHNDADHRVELIAYAVCRRAG